MLLPRVVFGGMIVCSALLMPTVSAEETGNEKVTARKVFENLNASPLEILKKTTRLDMLDYWDADSVYNAVNAMNGISRLANVTPDYLKVEITPVSRLEIKILPDRKGEIVMTVYSIGDSIQSTDSEVTFYTSDLVRLDREHYLPEFDLKNFFDLPKGMPLKMKDIDELIPFPTVEYSASPDNNDLTMRLTSDNFMNLDDKKEIEPYLRKEVELIWSGKYKIK